LAIKSLDSELDQDPQLKIWILNPALITLKICSSFMARQEAGSSHRINGDEAAAANGRRSVESTPQSGRRALSPPEEQLTLGRHSRYQLFIPQ
jgi:hypothetical protein